MNIEGATTWRVQQYREGDKVELVAVEPAPVEIEEEQIVLRSAPALLDEEVHHSDRIYEELYVADSALSEEARDFYESTEPEESWPGSEVRTLVDQGPSENRIDLTIVGDGYTEEQKCRFFEDAQRMTNDLFGGDTFSSYLPLFNVHAVFVPSKESGLTDTERKDTALGLYRSPRGSKRGILPGNYRAIENALRLAPDTDYPILVANDDFYGGLGGRYAITTRSHNSGSMVLRHELGHNFGNVGEEYDGGQVYSGANHSYSESVPWAHWTEDTVEAQEARSLHQSYPWKNLAEGPITVRLDVPEMGEDKPVKLGIHISSVGWETPGDVKILLDGEEKEYQGVFTEDRSFFQFKEPVNLPPGRHTLTIQQAVEDGNNVLAGVKVTAFPEDYDFTPAKVGAYPSFNYSNRHAGYRPTHEDCLMRNMRLTHFCPVDQENMWHQFLRRIELVDGVTTEELKDRDGNSITRIKLNTPDLPGLQIRWFGWQTPPPDEEGNPREPIEVELTHLANVDEWLVGPEDHGNYRVEVTFNTPEVRKYNDRFRAVRQITV